jgi:hypothetical protein
MSVTTLTPAILPPTAQQSRAFTHVTPNSSERIVTRNPAALALAPLTAAHAATAIKPMAVSLGRTPRRGP